MSNIINPNGPQHSVGSKMQQLENRLANMEMANVQLAQSLQQVLVMVNNQGAIMNRGFTELGLNVQEMLEKMDAEVAEAQEEKPEESASEES
jgi:uncharacterized coiled-coil protein SlyX